MGQIVNDIEEVLNNKKARKEAETERQKIIADMQRAAAEKTNLVKKALAAQRAKFGAGGSGGAAGGMSTEAVLKRLESETAEPYEKKLRDARDKLNKIKTPRTNLLKTYINKLSSMIFD